ncbi:conserved hypothetical protein [Perkinsus marinus ATCC 50983]|uniref:CH-like domain-containing protein n=1 Tax=Perkinsus marinus (strain ATCC 50983 / TXsc) TaxID=423536 RepID=C5KZY0_PERM5|nr:conserved hypothetical protein [Perkinsus marinus ATCC 50983]EER09838.1 conserved hypothetical protein [Perkinsus marinus ATCC 50983]|eukprot:XP_002778043.1 conserved hypothetical protein [Perkinsus marinus ATCC 50983]
MHSFDPGLSLATKQNNWETLFKFFKKYNVDITVEDFEPVIHNCPGAGINIVTKAYYILTKRRLGGSAGKIGSRDESTSSVVHGGVDSDAPNYAKNTASVVLKDPEIDRTVDDNARVLKALIALDAHNQEQLNEKARTGSNDSQYRLYPQGRPDVGQNEEELEPGEQGGDEPTAVGVEACQVVSVSFTPLAGERGSRKALGCDA